MTDRLILLPAVDVPTGRRSAWSRARPAARPHYGDPLAAALAWQAGRRRVDPSGRPRRGLRPRRQPRAARRGRRPPGRCGRALRRHPRRRHARGGPRHRLRAGQPRHRGPREPGLDGRGDRPARRGGRGRAGCAGHHARGPRLDPDGGDLWEMLARLEQAGLRALRRHRRHQGRHAPRTQPRAPAGGLRAHTGPGRGLRRDRQPGRPRGTARRSSGDGVEGAIVGKALYAGEFTLPQALDVAGRPSPTN